MGFLVIASADAYEFPPYRGIALKVVGGISGNYSNNVTYASDNENKTEDFRTLLNLGLDFQYKGKRSSFEFSGIAQRQIFEESFGDLNSSENITMTYNNEFTKYDRMTLRNTFRHTQEPGRMAGGFGMSGCVNYYKNSSLTQSEIEAICNEFQEEFGRLRGMLDSYSNNFSLAYSKIISNVFTLRTNYVYGQKRSSAEGTNDSDRNAFGLSLNYNYSQATSFSLSYNYQLSNYDKGNDISREAIKAGIKQYITKSLLFNGSIGKVAVSPGSDSILIMGGFSIDVDENTLADLSYSQGIEISANTNDTFENWRLSGTLSRIMQEDLRGSLSVFYGKGDYSATDVTDTFLGAGMDLSYYFWQGKRGSNMKVNIGYSYSDLDSTNESRKYTRTSINSGIGLSF